MKFARLLITSLFVVILLIGSTYFGIIRRYNGKFDDSWQHMIQLKYKRLASADSPRIIVIAGSSAAFGLDQRMIEEETGFKVCNLGLQASIGPMYLCELAKKNVRKGDVILFAYEYGWWNKWELFDSLRPDLLVSGIDNCYAMYEAIPLNKIPNFVGYIFEHRHKAKTYTGQSGTYSASSFDASDCQMIISRGPCFTYNKERDGVTDFSTMKIDEKCVKYFKKFKKQIESKGAEIYFTFPPVVDECVIGTEEEIQSFVNETEKMGIRVISSPQDYFLTTNYIYDGYCHCNSVGEILRTQQLLKDMKDKEVCKK